ncbi:ABC transporter related protein [Nitrosomonas sp. Is79A3]
MTLLEIRNVTKRLGKFTAVDNFSIEIKAGEFFTLLGPSGCGKTTLLRMIAGFDAPDGGQILLDGEDIVGFPPEKRPFHTVFQSYAPFPHMTVTDNIGSSLKMSGKTREEIKIRVAETLADKTNRCPESRISNRTELLKEGILAADWQQRFQRLSTNRCY